VGLYEAAARKHMFPCLLQYVEETQSIMGEGFWLYGPDRNVDICKLSFVSRMSNGFRRTR
jgi:hypothetical protein